MRAAALLAVLAAVAACAAVRPSLSESGATFVVVRHAEKSSDDAKDPSLSEAGLRRADRLALRLADEPLVAAYATGYRRTQSTAAPAAKAHGITVTVYDAQLPAPAFASRLRAAHARGTVLVVGHSNTVPGIVLALSGTPVAAIPDGQFDLLYRIRIDADGKATLSEDIY